jgi:hypothetical protein
MLLSWKSTCLVKLPTRPKQIKMLQPCEKATLASLPQPFSRASDPEGSGQETRSILLVELLSLKNMKPWKKSPIPNTVIRNALLRKVHTF